MIKCSVYSHSSLEILKRVAYILLLSTWLCNIVIMMGGALAVLMCIKAFGDRTGPGLHTLRERQIRLGSPRGAH